MRNRVVLVGTAKKTLPLNRLMHSEGGRPGAGNFAKPAHPEIDLKTLKDAT